jgi:hypothetical protein
MLTLWRSKVYNEQDEQHLSFKHPRILRQKVIGIDAYK